MKSMFCPGFAQKRQRQQGIYQDFERTMQRGQCFITNQFLVDANVFQIFNCIVLNERVSWVGR